MLVKSTDTSPQLSIYQNCCSLFSEDGFKISDSAILIGMLTDDRGPGRLGCSKADLANPGLARI